MLRRGGPSLEEKDDAVVLAEDHHPRKQHAKQQNKTTRRRRRQWKTLWWWAFICGILVAAQFLVRYHFPRRVTSWYGILCHWTKFLCGSTTKPLPNDQATTTTTSIVWDTVHDRLGNLYDPPKSLPLLLGDTGGIVPSRHLCLQAIRKRHEQAYQGLILQGGPHRNEILLVDPAYHPNVGDHMITLGEQTLVHQSLSVVVQDRSLHPLQSLPTYDECSYIQASTYAPHCSSSIAVESTTTRPYHHKVALWHGGGNWGNLWPQIQALRTESMEALLRANYTVLGMPQSLYFTNNETEMVNTRAFRETVQRGLGDIPKHKLNPAAQKKLILSWREHKSFDKGQQLYPYATHLLVPDIAFQLGPYSPVPTDSTKQLQPQVDILLLLRSDHESIFASQRNRESITSILSHVVGNNEQGRRYSFSIVDWPDRLDRFEDANRETSHNFLFTDTALRLLNLGRVVVCDRLHASILAYLGGLSFVYLDQVSGKIEKTMTVAMESDPVCDQDTWDARKVDRSRPPWRAKAPNLTDGIRIAVDMLRVLHPGSRRNRRRHDP